MQKKSDNLINYMFLVLLLSLIWSVLQCESNVILLNERTNVWVRIQIITFGQSEWRKKVTQGDWKRKRKKKTAKRQNWKELVFDIIILSMYDTSIPKVLPTQLTHISERSRAYLRRIQLTFIYFIILEENTRW